MISSENPVNVTEIKLIVLYIDAPTPPPYHPDRQSKEKNMKLLIFFAAT